MLRHSHEFLELPSERSKASSKAGSVMLKVMDNAAAFSSFGYNLLSDKAKRAQDRLQRAIERGEEIELEFETRPGAFIERQSEEVRAQLRKLTSFDLREIQIDPNLVHDWHQHMKPGQRSKFWPGTIDLYESLPRIFSMSTTTT
jgi:hypothetical protein